MNFATLKGLTIPEGVVKKITRTSDSVVLWNGKKEYLYGGVSTLTLDMPELTEDVSNFTKTSDYLSITINKRDTSPLYIYINDALVATTTTKGAQTIQIDDIVVNNGLYGKSNILKIQSEGDFELGEQKLSTSYKENVESKPENISKESSCSNCILDTHVVVIGLKAFYYATITNIVIPDSVTSIGEQAFNGAHLTSIVIPDSVTSIGNSAFNSANLTSIVIPDSVTSIGNSAFNGCLYLTEAAIGCGVKTISSRMFSGCTDLVSVILPSGLTDIGNYAFYDCPLTSIIIPDGVTSIGSYSFQNTDLSSIEFPNSLISIGAYAFDSVYFDIVNIPKNVNSIGALAFDIDIGSITVDSENTSYCVVDNVLYSKDKTFLHTCLQRTGSFTVPNSVMTIGRYAFNFNNITSIVIPNSVTTIEAGAFDHCEIASIVIPNGITTIEDNTFNYSYLTSVVIPNSVTTIEASAFNYCKALTSITFEHDNSDVLTIENKCFILSTALNTTIYHYGNDVVLNYGWSDDKRTVTFVQKG